MNQYTGAKVKVTPEVERQIVRDYAGELPLKAIRIKYGVTDWTINTIRLKWGLRRYQTHAAPKHPTLRRAEIRARAPWDEADGPTPQRCRCECGGIVDLGDPTGHRCRWRAA